MNHILVLNNLLGIDIPWNKLNLTDQEGWRNFEVKVLVNTDPRYFIMNREGSYQNEGAEKNCAWNYLQRLEFEWLHWVHIFAFHWNIQHNLKQVSIWPFQPDNYKASFRRIGGHKLKMTEKNNPVKIHKVTILIH